jgi:D-proline reductase (dithiol) PrdB
MDTKQLLQDILKAPSSAAAFSRIRYVGTLMEEEQQITFLKELFNAAVEAREAGNSDRLYDLLEEWEASGQAIAGGRSRVLELDATPWAPLTVPISKAKFAVVTTGGFYVEGQEPYETDGPERQGDWSYRAIPKGTPNNRINVAHLHYDLSGPQQDINCVFPLDRFAELEKEGVIGQLADTNYSFMGFIQRPDLLIAETAPQVARRLKEDGVEAVFLTST